MPRLEDRWAGSNAREIIAQTVLDVLTPEQRSELLEQIPLDGQPYILRAPSLDEARKRCTCSRCGKRLALSGDSDGERRLWCRGCDVVNHVTVHKTIDGATLIVATAATVARVWLGDTPASEERS